MNRLKPRKLVVINRKGGCGKTTLTTNLAGYFASRGDWTALYDYDPQYSAMRWLRMRPRELMPIHGVAAASIPGGTTTRAFQLRVPPETRQIIVDTPASLKRMELIDVLREASALLIPVLPSAIDLHVTAEFIADLRNMARLYAPGAAIAVVANRVRESSRSLQTLEDSLGDLGFPPVARLFDSDNYINAADNGASIYEMDDDLIGRDRSSWEPLLEWVGAYGATDTPAPAPKSSAEC